MGIKEALRHSGEPLPNGVKTCEVGEIGGGESVLVRMGTCRYWFRNSEWGLLASPGGGGGGVVCNLVNLSFIAVSMIHFLHSNK